MASQQEDSREDRSYRFISDPSYDETLSGRVRSACKNCRRKKVKCSGETPCTTCLSKGDQCEGMASRKRSKRTKKQPRGVFSVSDTKWPCKSLSFTENDQTRDPSQSGLSSPSWPQDTLNIVGDSNSDPSMFSSSTQSFQSPCETPASNESSRDYFLSSNHHRSQGSYESFEVHDAWSMEPNTLSQHCHTMNFDVASAWQADVNLLRLTEV